MMKPPPRDHLHRIMYWTTKGDGIALLAELVFAAFTGRRSPLTDPTQCVRADVPIEKRRAVADLLARGKVLETYFGDATCRMCGVTLGNKDLYGYGFMWPEKAEHYVLEHNVWMPSLDELLTRSGN